MNIKEAVEKACEEPTLIDALSWICVWESERAIAQAKLNLVDADGKGWDTCFKFYIERVFEVYKKPKSMQFLNEYWRCNNCGNWMINPDQSSVSTAQEPSRKDGEPCSHTGCRNHITHPCERCFRIAARGEFNPSKHHYFL